MGYKNKIKNSTDDVTRKKKGASEPCKLDKP